MTMTRSEMTVLIERSDIAAQAVAETEAELEGLQAERDRRRSAVRWRDHLGPIVGGDRTKVADSRQATMAVADAETRLDDWRTSAGALEQKVRKELDQLLRADPAYEHLVELSSHAETAAAATRRLLALVSDATSAVAAVGQAVKARRPTGLVLVDPFVESAVVNADWYIRQLANAWDACRDAVWSYVELDRDQVRIDVPDMTLDLEDLARRVWDDGNSGLGRSLLARLSLADAGGRLPDIKARAEALHNAITHDALLLISRHEAALAEARAHFTIRRTDT